jgi:hypothetical protein
VGYNLYIVRGPDFWGNPDHQISADEWHRYIETDHELTLAPDHGPHFALWSGPSTYPEPWLNWFKGFSIYSKNPDDAIINKMLQIAVRLSAHVRGENEEIYTSPTEFFRDD